MAKVADITDLKVLNRLVAECRGWKLYNEPVLFGPKPSRQGWYDGDKKVCSEYHYTPTTNRDQWAELAEINNMRLDLSNGMEAMAWLPNSEGDLCYGNAPTPGIAVCKAYIVSVTGEEIEPDAT